VEVACGAGGGDRVPGDLLLSSTYADEELKPKLANEEAPSKNQV